MTGPRIAVVGAGLAGLTAAHRLARVGLAVTVFDKGRGIGGRLSVRRTDLGPFDHGAQVYDGADAGFRDFLAKAERRGFVRRWEAGDGRVGVPDMKAPLRPLAEALDLRLSVRVAALWQTGLWTLTDASDLSLGRFERVILAVPAPQARELVGGDAELAAALDRVAMVPQWAAMLAFEDPPGDFSVLRPGGALDLIADMAAKPGREGPARRWVVHASADWTRAHLEWEPREVENALLAEVSDTLGARLPALLYSAVHRWRYSRCETPLGLPFLASADRSLLIGGDWALGGETGDAYASGAAMAETLLADLQPAAIPG